jgi:hypothetical protein
MSIDQLIDRFIEEANRVGTIVRIERTKVPLDSPEWDQGNTIIRNLARELIRRNAFAAVRARLFENPSPDVRGWAGMKWCNADPAWATAAFTGVLKRMTTREVLDWRDRVLRGPPSLPALHDMTVAQLLERFVDACERYYGGTRFLMDEDGGGFGGDVYTKTTGEVLAVAKELKARGELEALIPLLDHPCITVREKAARCCVEIAKDKALSILQFLAKDLNEAEGREADLFLTLRRLEDRNLP